MLCYNVSMLKRFLYLVEKGGNALPHPALLFGILALATLLLSLVGAVFAWSGVHPATDEQIDIVNLLSREGIHRIILNMVSNFTNFAPLGIVMVAVLGIGVAESSGLIRAAINLMLLKTPPQFITAMVVFAGVISSVAADVGYVLVIPLAGIIFHSLGRHPIAGLSAAFAGVSAGFSANIFLAPLDPMLAGITTESAHIYDQTNTYYVLPTAYYYFMCVSTILITIVCTVLTEKWIEPRLGKYSGDVERESIEQPSALEKKGLFYVGLTVLGWILLLAAGLVPENGILRADDGSFLNSPVLRGIIALLFLSTASVGIVYGFTVGKFTKAEDVINAMTDNIKTLAGYLVLVFFAAQFVAWFNWSNLGLLLAIQGASLLENADISLVPLIIIFVTLTGGINLFIGSASAKWALVGPIYVPVFMALGYSPELAQSVYSVGDSMTNIITPLMPYFALILVYYQKYDKNAGIGTIIATMLPFTVMLYITWTGLLIGWVLLELPLGPGTPLYYTPSP